METIEPCNAARRSPFRLVSSGGSTRFGQRRERGEWDGGGMPSSINDRLHRSHFRFSSRIRIVVCTLSCRAYHQGTHFRDSCATERDSPIRVNRAGSAKPLHVQPEPWRGVAGQGRFARTASAATAFTFAPIGMAARSTKSRGCGLHRERACPQRAPWRTFRRRRDADQHECVGRIQPLEHLLEIFRTHDRRELPDHIA